MSTEIVKYETGNGIVELSPEIIRKYLVAPDAKVSDQEVVMFLNLCKYQKLNPFLREVYLIKYGAQPATMVTGKETFLKRAMNNPKYRGHETFITDDGKIATAKVYVQDYQVPITVSVDYDEYVGTKDEWKNNVKTGNKIPNGMWASKPKTMLKKVALVQALREAFPDSFGGLYSQEEISHIDTEKLPTAPVETPAEVQETEKQENKPETPAEKPVETVTPEVVTKDENPFKPYAKGGENVKAKEKPVEVKPAEVKSQGVMLGTPGHDPELPPSPAAMIDDLKAKSAKLRDDYSTKIAELKTRAQCEALCKELASKAGDFTELDRNILKGAFASKRDEILAALPKTETPTRPEFKIGDKVKVRAKAGGNVMIEGEITAIKTVDGKPAASLKKPSGEAIPMPVFLANCYLE